jgi:hypothetical protein
MKRTLALAVFWSMIGCGRDDPAPELPTTSVGACRYTNRFSSGGECRDYLGAWEASAAEADCAEQGDSATFGTADACDAAAAVGWCVFGEETAGPTRITFDGGNCAENERGCEVFGGGLFVSEGTCGNGGDGSGNVLRAPFPEPEETCRAPIDGEDVGRGTDGSVCQFNTMQGCTEPGRKWEDYGSCDIPRQQRGYYPAPTAANAERDDPRLAQPAYAAELDWVKSELGSCACVCCHLSTSPLGPSNWYLDQPGNFINGMLDSGIAQGAGIIDSVVLGNISAADNNGFTRLPSIFPSTDPARMQAFFQAEFMTRGLAAADFAGLNKYGPLGDQYAYVPTACGVDEGIDSAGVVTWRGGPARIVYVMDPGTQNPGVPPNLDTPEGVLWRLDAASPTTSLLQSGLTYGAVPAASLQKHPTDGSAPPLVAGGAYYLYVMADYVAPITRCLFTYKSENL